MKKISINTIYPIILFVLINGLFLYPAVPVNGPSTPFENPQWTKENDPKTKEIDLLTFRRLPFGRDFTSLFSILPGVNSEDLLSGLSVHGASGAENRFFIDNAETTDLLNGTSSQQVNLDFAESVTFKTFGFDASDDAAMGGTINVITRSGTNRFHGEIIGYYNSEKLTGKERKKLYLDVNDSSKAAYYSYEETVGIEEWDRYELGVNLGGPIIKDKLWFFGSVMPTFYDRSGTYDFAIQGYEGDPQQHTREETTMNYMVKLTACPVKGLSMGASFMNNHFKYKGNSVYNRSSSTTFNHSDYGFSYPNFSLSGYMDITPSKNFQVSLRGGYFHTNQHKQLVTVNGPRLLFRPPSPYGYAASSNEKWADYYIGIGREDLIKPAIGWSNYGYSDGFETKKAIRDRVSLNGDLSWYLEGPGKHAVKAGIQYNNEGEDVDSSPSYPYMYFAWDMDFEAYGVPYGRGEYGWVAIQGNSDAPFGNIYDVRRERLALYLQDHITIGNKFTLNLGIRAESEYLPNYTDNPDYLHIKKPIKFPMGDKISPRLGFVYDFKGDGNLKIFGHFGIYRDFMKLYLAANAFGGFKLKSAYYPLDTLRYDLLTGEEGEPWVILDHRSPSYDEIDPEMKPMTQREISLGFQKILSPNLILSGHIINKSLLRAIEDVGILLPGIGEYYYYTNPGSDFVKSKYQEARDGGTMEPDTPDLPKAKREYWGVTLNLEKRFSDYWMGGISVTWSSLRGNYSGLVSADENGRNTPYTERAFDQWHLLYTKDLQPVDGPLPTDRPIVAKACGSYMFPFGLTVGMVMNAMSGTPLTEEWNVESISYFPYNRGNMGRTPFLWLTDLLVGYDIHIGKIILNLNATVQNLFNAKTATGIFNRKTRYGVSPTDREKIDNSWTFESKMGTVDPRFGMDNTFVPPIEIRLGARIMF